MATLRQSQTRITVTGSNIIANWNGDQLQLTGSISASTAQTASYVDIVGDGIIVNYSGSQIQLTGSTAAPFPYTGSANVSGSIGVDGPIYSNKEVEAQSIVLKNGTVNYRFIPSASQLHIEKFDGVNWISVGAMF